MYLRDVLDKMMGKLTQGDLWAALRDCPVACGRQA